MESDLNTNTLIFFEKLEKYHDLKTGFYCQAFKKFQNSVQTQYKNLEYRLVEDELIVIGYLLTHLKPVERKKPINFWAVLFIEYSTCHDEWGLETGTVAEGLEVNDETFSSVCLSMVWKLSSKLLKIITKTDIFTEWKNNFLEEQMTI